MPAPIDNTPTPPPAPPLNQDGLPIGSALKPGWESSPRQVQLAMRSATPPILLDCRRPEEWAACRIDGALHIPMQQIEQRLDELDDIDPTRARPIIVYCHLGVRSQRVAATLRGHGFSNVLSMAGGIDLWSIAVDSSVPRY